MPKGVYPRKKSSKKPQPPKSVQFESLAKVVHGLGQAVALGFRGVAERLATLEARVKAFEGRAAEAKEDEFVLVYDYDDDDRIAFPVVRGALATEIDELPRGASRASSSWRGSSMSDEQKEQLRAIIQRATLIINGIEDGRARTGEDLEDAERIVLLAKEILGE